METHRVPDGYFMQPHTYSQFGQPDVPWFVILFFGIVVCIIVFALVSAMVRFFANAGSPVLETPATVIGKRTEVSRRGGNPNQGGFIYTTYYVAFEYASGERREFEVKGSQFGVLLEGDRGTLVSQGTWFQDFVR